MKMKKIIAGAAAAALAVSMTAFSVSAETIAIDSEYPGDWTSTLNCTIPTDLQTSTL